MPIAQKQVQTDVFGQWFGRLQELRLLQPGWDSYSAEPPTQEAITSAERFLYALQSASLEPTRIDASVMGGVGVTHRKGQRKVYIEFYNDGRVHALFSDRTPKMFTIPVEPTSESYTRLIEQSREYLDG